MKRAIAKAEGKKVTNRHAAKAGHVAGGTTGGAVGNLHDGYAANQASDLGAAC